MKVYYKLLKLNQTVTAELSLTINRFKSSFEISNNSSNKVILLHDNTLQK